MRSWALLLIGCATQRHIVVEEPPDPPIGRLIAPLVIVERPMIQLASFAPGLDREKPWPLEHPPSLDRHWAFTAQCDAYRGTQARGSVGAYVAAWCTLDRRANDPIAIDALAAVGATESIVGRAARLDVIDRLVLRGDTAHTAIAFLARRSLDTAENLDRLAATFGALGFRDAAIYTSSRASLRDNSGEARCERALAWSSLPHGLVEVEEAVDMEFDLGGCTHRALSTSCALRRAGNRTISLGARLVAVRDCYNAFPDDDVEARSWLAVAAMAWPAGTPEEWFELAQAASHALLAPLPDAEPLAIAALNNALATTSCERSDTTLAIAELAAQIAASPHHDRAHDRRLSDLRTSCLR